jgi:cell division septum initiation protein DivIVA
MDTDDVIGLYKQVFEDTELAVLGWVHDAGQRARDLLVAADGERHRAREDAAHITDEARAEAGRILAGAELDAAQVRAQSRLDGAQRQAEVDALRDRLSEMSGAVHQLLRSLEGVMTASARLSQPVQTAPTAPDP